ncbi:response regulator transcription factor [Kribbella sp. NPDC058693]|uniref:response regulator transcription factor n=1 Tax=Kribbella sp. NPDC058693 TaxID=3346602 RepID=UPI0036608BDD
MGTTTSPVLTAEQLEVIGLLATGLSDASIARRLNLGRRTVGRRISQIYDLLGVTSRFQAGMAVARLGLLDFTPDADPSPARWSGWRGSGSPDRTRP